MKNVTWKISGLLLVTSGLIGLMAGLLTPHQIPLETPKPALRRNEGIKTQVTGRIPRLMRTFAGMAQQANIYRKNWLTTKGLWEWQEGFLEFPSIAPAKISKRNKSRSEQPRSEGPCS